MLICFVTADLGKGFFARLTHKTLEKGAFKAGLTRILFPPEREFPSITPTVCLSRNAFRVRAEKDLYSRNTHFGVGCHCLNAGDRTSTYTVFPDPEKKNSHRSPHTVLVTVPDQFQ